MTQLYLVQGDNGSKIKVTITRDDTGDAVDLTGATTTLKFKKKNTSTVLSSINSSAGEPVDLTSGVAVFQFATLDLVLSPGDYVGEVQITFSDDSIETVFEQIEFTVREDF